MIATDSKCVSRFWRYGDAGWTVFARVKVPDGPSSATNRVIWAVGNRGGIVADASGKVLTKPVNPCADTPQEPAYIAARSATQATLVCTRAAVAAGQVRLVYVTTDGGKTWAEIAGARTLGTKATGRKDGLDGDGRLIALSSLGGRDVGALLAKSGCDGLQLRTSKDDGRNWTVAGCLPASLANDPVSLGGTASRTVVVGTDGSAPVTYVSTDRAKSWLAA
jgi:photosystem II stability/assembly factor-like uncharacterized protein